MVTISLAGGMLAALPKKLCLHGNQISKINLFIRITVCVALAGITAAVAARGIGVFLHGILIPWAIIITIYQFSPGASIVAGCAALISIFRNAIRI
jgi:hypothetical protein